ncbi:hypothetical protein RHGRI_004302 [Rhododendron griersonianum]|uniref:Aminotransferase-like plant mobile domain-containing protein n=1 Tax=Rhododendron griersonianum TaxID=479676 RepID=A0AAV6L956_9ERIC|nr:hypothetical protein RHGRI_004302 [Rhododendron griersonianum]
MSVQEAPITPTLERISTNHIAGRSVRERSYSSSSSSSPKFLIGVDEDSAASNNWDQYASSNSTSPTSNWEVEPLNPPTDRVLVVMDYPPIRTFFHHHCSLTMSRYYATSVMESPHLSLLDSLLSSSLRPPFYRVEEKEASGFASYRDLRAKEKTHPLPNLRRILRDNDDLDWVHWVRKNFVCWPVLDSNWCQWTERMFTMKNDHLVKVGLKDLIRLLQSGIPQNPSLIHAALAFWDPSFNCFHFNCGMMAPTVFDVTHLLGLLPYGPMFDIIASSSIPFFFPDLNSGNSSYTKFFNAEMETTSDVFDREFFSYLLYTLCKHILCHGVKR